MLLYVHNSITSSLCTELDSFKNESIWCRMSAGTGRDSDDIHIGVVYNSPNADISEINEMFSVIRFVSGRQVLVMGDFNYPDIDWDCLESDSVGESFLNLVQDCFLFQHVLTPTRGNNILDLVLSSEEGMVEDLQVCEHLANSDHNMTSFKLVCSTIISDTSRIVYDFNKGNYVKMNDMLNAVDWDIVLTGQEVIKM